MKKDLIYLVIIAVLVIFLFIQSNFNQPHQNPVNDDKHPIGEKGQAKVEIGRYQFFSSPKEILHGILDTKEGFIWLVLRDTIIVRDIKNEFRLYVLRSFIQSMQEAEAFPDSVDKEDLEYRFQWQQERVK